MARRTRDDAPGIVHHVMVRGIERRLIFVDDRDREEWVRRVTLLVLELGFRCFGWVLMPNHYHLLLRSGAVSISRLMARLGTGYARYFNLRHDRVGHLFQNRFRSRRAVDDADLMGLVLYVCRNPLAGRLVADPSALEGYRWCSAGALAGQRAAYPFEAVDDTLALFDADPSRARDRFRTLLGVPSPEPASRRGPDRRRPLLAALRDAGSMEHLVGEVCAEYAVSKEELCTWRRRSHRIASARAAFAARAARELCLPGSAIARALQMTPSAVTRMLVRAGSRPAERGN